ncbi:hypothetical protein [Sulfitobacter sp. DSM 110093]|uniref:hypothetical protein n=1 Tax=Sulfitobacter sp. DSM 110093 TaxID=2883127 RepID=UPI001FAD370A|nr:hypothetical protein [Sulfitobacter sp. DSM 110093]
MPSLLLTGLLASPAFGGPEEVAISSFNDWCFKAGQTKAQARANTDADTASFTLTFWDDSLEPRPNDAPRGVERRCEVAFDGDHTAAAITALRTQMATPPVFGDPIPLPETHNATPGTALIEGRELLRGRVAVVHVGTRNAVGKAQTFMAVDRLYDGLGLPKAVSQ